MAGAAAAAEAGDDGGGDGGGDENVAREIDLGVGLVDALDQRRRSFADLSQSHGTDNNDSVNGAAAPTAPGAAPGVAALLLA